jgi:hypothetical protein
MFSHMEDERPDYLRRGRRLQTSNMDEATDPDFFPNNLQDSGKLHMASHRSG